MKRTIEDCNNWAKQKGGHCLSSVYLNANSKMDWICASGHKWSTSPNKIRIGSWCPECFMPSITIDKCRQVASQRGGRCLSNVYRNNNSKLEFTCKDGHKWSASWRSIVQGNWCPSCGIKRSHDLQRFSIEHCQDVASKNGGECLSTYYINSDTKYEWKCKEGHMWNALYSSVSLNKTWCKICANTESGISKRNKIEDAHELARIKGGKCLSTSYEKALKKLMWQCGSCLHEWSATYNNVQRGRWCPECQSSKTEKQVRAIVESLLLKTFPKRRFKFKGKRFELDCFNEELGLGVEYDGEQHYIPISYWGGAKGLADNKARDKFKDLACQSLGIVLIRVPYTEKNNLSNFIINHPIFVTYYREITKNVKVVE